MKYFVRHWQILYTFELFDYILYSLSMPYFFFMKLGHYRRSRSSWNGLVEIAYCALLRLDSFSELSSQKRADEVLRWLLMSSFYNEQQILGNFLFLAVFWLLLYISGTQISKRPNVEYAKTNISVLSEIISLNTS